MSPATHLRRLRRLVHRRRVERDMADEMRAHVEMEAESLMRDGMGPAEARRQALLRFGGVDRYTEEARDAWPLRWAEATLLDARFALRSLHRSPTFTIAAVLALALGIGANAAVFSAIDAVLMAPLPYPAPGRLVQVQQLNPGGYRGTLSNADWQAIRAQQHSFSSVALMKPGGAALATPAGAEWVDVGWVTGDFFRALGVRPARGTGFRAADDDPAAPPTVVVSSAFAAAHLGGGNPLGQTVTLDRHPYTVVGVLAPGVTRLAGMKAEAWAVLHLPTPERKGPFGYRAVGRLKEGVTLDDAARDLAGISERIFPLWQASFQDRGARLAPVPLRQALLGDGGRPLKVLGAAVALVLLIAVANVANLVLVRASARRREIALRAALGAGGARLARMLLTENVVLGALGGAAGLILAAAGIRVLARIGPRVPRLDEASLDLRVAAFAAVAAGVSGVLVGLYPVLFALPKSLDSSLRAGGQRAGTGRGTRLFQTALVVAEFALTLPLLYGAGLLLHSFANLSRVDPGFDVRGVVTARVVLPESAYPDAPAQLRFWEQALRQVRDLPGVRQAGLSSTLPPDNHGDTNNFDLVDRPVPAGSSQPQAPWAFVTPEYLATLGVPLLEGRPIAAADDSATPPVALVSRAWARHFYPHQSAVGRRMREGGCTDCDPVTVVGVVGDVKYQGLSGGGEAVYQPVRQQGGTELYLVVRAAGDPAALAARVRERVQALDPAVPLAEVGTMEERLADSIATTRRLAWLLGAFAAVAVALTALGTFGVLSYVVAQRRRELAVRTALGARGGDLFGMIVRDGLARAAAGLALGGVVAVAGTRVLRSVLFQVTPADPLTLSLALAVAALTAIVGCALPALRAARTDPALCIRAD